MLPIRSTTFKLNADSVPANNGPLIINLQSAAAEGKKLTIKCSGNHASGGSSWPWDSVTGGVAHGLDGDAKECVLDAEMESRVVKITHTKNSEVAFVGITFANGKTVIADADGAGIYTVHPGLNTERLKLVTKFCKFYMNVAVRSPLAFPAPKHKASTLLTPCAARAGRRRRRRARRRVHDL